MKTYIKFLYAKLCLAVFLFFVGNSFAQQYNELDDGTYYTETASSPQIIVPCLGCVDSAKLVTGKQSTEFIFDFGFTGANSSGFRPIESFNEVINNNTGLTEGDRILNFNYAILREDFQRAQARQSFINRQYDKVKFDIEKKLGRNFSNLRQAQNAFFRSKELPFVRQASAREITNIAPKVKEKEIIRKRCLTNIKLLDLRAAEIRAGRVNNSQYGAFKYGSSFVGSIRSLGQLNTFRQQEVAEFTDNEWRLDREKRILNQLRRELSNLINRDHAVLNRAANLLVSQIENYGNNDFDRLDLMSVFIHGARNPSWANEITTFRPYSYSIIKNYDPNYIADFVWNNNEVTSLFHPDFWLTLPNVSDPQVIQHQVQRERDARIAEALSGINLNDIAGQTAIATLGTSAESFEGYINARPLLRAELENYFKLNNYSKGAHDCANYLLNQYLGGGNTFFTLGQNYYGSASTPLRNSSSSPNLALGTTLNALAVRDQFTYFNNVLGALLNDNVHRPEYKGQIIREMFVANNVSIPAGLDNATLSTYFDFAPTAENQIRIEHSGRHGSKANLDQYLRDLKDFHNGVQDILNSPVPTGSSTFAYVNYENRIAEVLSFTNDTDALEVAKLFQTDAARNAYLKLEHHRAIAACGKNIIKTGFPEQLEFRNLDPEGLRIITKEAVEVAAIDDIAQEIDQGNNFWPENAEEWEAVVDVMAPLLGELALGFVPGSDAIELFRSINTGDAVGASIAVAGLLVDLAGLRAVRGALKAVRVFRKAFIIGRKLGRVIKAAGRAARNGFTTTIDAAGRLILEKGGRIIARGDAVKDYLVDLAREVSNAVSSRLANVLSSGVKKNLDDAIARGDFLPEIVEDSVEEIAEATAKKGSPLSWDQVKALFKRGNDFNKKAVNSDWYDFHEIHLGNGKRLDSYDEIAGEIVSRKATDLGNINFSTFDNYLKEMGQKYSPGTTIRSNKYPELDGKTLQGQQILEIPASNQSLSNIQDYINHAWNNYGIRIRFRPE